MTLPDRAEIDRIIASRPGDALYTSIKEYLPRIKNTADSVEHKLVELIIDDLVTDLGVSKALDKVGIILNYHAEENGIQAPAFDGNAMLHAITRVGKLAFSLKLAEFYDLGKEAKQALLEADIDRLWFDKKRSHPSKDSTELLTVLKQLQTTLNEGKQNDKSSNSKKRKDGAGGK